MCGRYTATQVNPALIADRFGVREQAVPGETLGRFNVCPTEPVLAHAEAIRDERRVDLRRRVAPAHAADPTRTGGGCGQPYPRPGARSTMAAGAVGDDPWPFLSPRSSP